MKTDIHTKIERRPPFNPVENLDPFFLCGPWLLWRGLLGTSERAKASCDPFNGKQQQVSQTAIGTPGYAPPEHCIQLEQSSKKAGADKKSADFWTVFYTGWLDGIAETKCHVSFHIIFGYIWYQHYRIWRLKYCMRTENWSDGKKGVGNCAKKLLLSLRCPAFCAAAILS